MNYIDEIISVIDELLDSEEDDVMDGEFKEVENAPCDNAGFCVGTGCSMYFRCKSH